MKGCENPVSAAGLGGTCFSCCAVTSSPNRDNNRYNTRSASCTTIQRPTKHAANAHDTGALEERRGKEIAFRSIAHGLGDLPLIWRQRGALAMKEPPRL